MFYMLIDVKKLFFAEKMEINWNKLYVYKVNLFLMERDKYHPSLLCILFARDKILFFHPRHRRPCIVNDYRIEAEDWKVLSALCNYCSKVEQNDFMQEARSRSIKGSTLKLIILKSIYSIHELVPRFLILEGL